MSKQKATKLFATCVLMVMFPFCAVAQSSNRIIINSKGMEPTCNVGDVAWYNGLQSTNGTLIRGDIVIFKSPQDVGITYIKRIIGLPGETILIKSGKISINRKILDEPYLGKDTVTDYYQDPQKGLTAIVPASHYFVLGDNRAASYDSRVWGFVPKNNIIGKVKECSAQ